MAKRFTDTDKYKKPFIRSLQGAYKLLWDYLYHDCNHAGVWIVDFEIAQIYLGKDMPVNREDALGFFNTGEDRIVEFAGASKWFILPFITFQYGNVLNPKNRVHKSVLDEMGRHSELKKYIKGLTSPLQRAKDKDKEKDKDKDKYKDTDTIIDYLNKCSGGEYRHSKASREPIHARLDDGFSLDDCLAVVEFYSKEWKGTEVEKYLRPTTLFGPKKFEGYVSAAKRWISKGRPNLKSNGRSFERDEDELDYPDGEEIFNE